MLGGVSVALWFEIFLGTHSANGMGGFTRVEWPDGGSYLDQPSVTVAALKMVEEALVREAARGTNVVP
jgi:hypothetical protein